MKDGFLSVRAASPALRVADCDYNTEQIILQMRGAAADGVRLLCLPELCLEALCICHAVWSGLETPEARTRAATIAAAICRIRPSRSPFL